MSRTARRRLSEAIATQSDDGGSWRVFGLEPPEVTTLRGKMA
jgi:hypothetical protein